MTKCLLHNERYPQSSCEACQKMLKYRKMEKATDDYTVVALYFYKHYGIHEVGKHTALNAIIGYKLLCGTKFVDPLNLRDTWFSSQNGTIRLTPYAIKKAKQHWYYNFNFSSLIEKE